MTRALLRIASWVVPGADRADWLAEWSGELWHVTRAGGPAVAFCLGAFLDALWLRRHNQNPRAAVLATPARCLGALAGMACAAGLWIPAFRPPWNVVEVRSHGRHAPITYEQYRLIAANLPSNVEAVAFYRPGRKAVATRNMDAVLQGARLPDCGRYSMVDDPGSGPGSVVARVSRRGPWFHISAPSPRGGRVVFDCFPLEPGDRAMATFLIFALAVVLLPMLTTVSLGGLARGWRAWSFFATKLVLAVAGAYLVSAMVGVILAPMMLAHGLLIGTALAIRWAFRDQRRRCPVCLHKLASPVSFGCLGHTLLEWHGSEFICPEGHGLLQESATTASPYAPLRWLPL